MDDQRETIIPRHYCVVGYKKNKSHKQKMNAVYTMYLPYYSDKNARANNVHLQQYAHGLNCLPFIC